MEKSFLQCEQVLTTLSDTLDIDKIELISLRDLLGEKVLHLLGLSPKDIEENFTKLLKADELKLNETTQEESETVQTFAQISKQLTENTKGHSWQDISMNHDLPDEIDLKNSLEDIFYNSSGGVLDGIEMPGGITLWNGDKETVGDFVRYILIDMLIVLQTGFYLSSTAYTAEIEAWEKVFFTYISSPLNKTNNYALKGTERYVK